MKSIVIMLNKVLYLIGKCFNKGSSLPGKVALKLDENILSKIRLPKEIIMVTGSNGKTSTTEMICSILEKNGYNVACNKEGSNQIEGVTTMILNACSLVGRVKKDVLVIEADERYLRLITKFIKPNFLIITNLYRDQLTRNGHQEYIYDIIKEGIPENTHLILNTDDPLSSLYGYKNENVTYVGLNREKTDLTENNSVYNDCKYCPNCKNLLSYDYYHFSHIGKYRCENCGHERKNPDFAVTDIDLDNGELVINNEYKINMIFKSFYNAYNIVFSFAVAKLIGINEEKIVQVLNEYIIKNDRVQTFNINGKHGTLLTSKHENSISYNQSIQYITRTNKPCIVVIIVDTISRKYFTSETSWLWDIDFELLNNDCVKNVVIAGKYVHDLAIRLKFTNIDKNIIFATDDLDKVMEYIKHNVLDEFYVITCFSDRMKFINRIS